MSGQPVAPVSRPRPSRLDRVWRWGAFGIMPFVVALTTAMAVTASVDARGRASAGSAGGAPAGPQSAPTLARLMNLSPLPDRAAPGFSLTDQHGREVSLASFRGKTVLLGFLDLH